MPTYAQYKSLYSMDPSNPPDCACSNSQISLFGVLDKKTNKVNPATQFVTPSVSQNALCGHVLHRIATCRRNHADFETRAVDCENVASGVPLLVLDAISSFCNLTAETIAVSPMRDLVHLIGFDLSGCGGPRARAAAVAHWRPSCHGRTQAAEMGVMKSRLVTPSLLSPEDLADRVNTAFLGGKTSGARGPPRVARGAESRARASRWRGVDWC